MRIHKLAFAFEQKIGFPHYRDSGIADLTVGGFGLSIYVSIPKDAKGHVFLIDNVKAKLSKLRIKVHESRHRILHGLAGFLANSYLVKRLLRHLIAEGITIGLKQLDLSLVEMRLNEDEEEDRLTYEEIKRRAAALRDLMAKYHEHAGTLEIDFKREDDPERKKRWEDAHAVRWAKNQLEKTAMKEVVRNEWRSNAFDLPGKDTVQPPEPAPASTSEQPTATTSKAQETHAEAREHGKLAPTTEGTVKQAEEDLDEVEREKQADGKPQMVSEAGKRAEKETGDRGEQVQKLESAVERIVSRD